MITERALDFLVENQLNDSKEWFEAHREEYEKYVREPFFEIIDFLTERLGEEIEPEIMRDHRRALCRVRRDTRFTKDKTKYRANVWAMLGRDRRYYRWRPEFFFELRPGFSWWGCGMYLADAPVRDSYVRMVSSRSPEFLNAAEAFDAQEVFGFDSGDEYRRTKFPDEPPEIRRWLDRKGIYLVHTGPAEDMYAPDIAQRLISDFRLLYPYYTFLLAVCDGAVRQDLVQRGEQD